jgi:hypothetical protein
MSDILETEEVELTIDKLDSYLEAAAHIVDELGVFLGAHHLELMKAHHAPNQWGSSLTMPKAYDDPGYAARIHQLKQACDAFCNAMRGNY